MEFGPGLWHYWLFVILLMMGLYTLIAKRNLVKKMIGLNLFQVAVILFYVTMGKVEGGTAPILIEGAPPSAYSNPLPHVLMLTAIVVGIATTALGLSLIVRIKEAYGTIEEDEIARIDRDHSRSESDLFPSSPPGNDSVDEEAAA
jgi:multicomponent Na+:H+ antiporter subunit C